MKLSREFYVVQIADGTQPPMDIGAEWQQLSAAIEDRDRYIKKGGFRATDLRIVKRMVVEMVAVESGEHRTQ